MTTIKDVAQMAGVSISTVSHVVNKTKYVSPELVQKVEDALRKLDTPPNFVVKKLSQERELAAASRFVAVLHASDLTLVDELRARLIKENIPMLALDYRYPEELAVAAPLLSSENCSAVLVLPGGQTNHLNEVLFPYSVPKLAVGSKVPGVKNVVSLDEVKAVAKAIRHLLRSGHEQIAYLSAFQSRNDPQVLEYCHMLEQSGIEIQERLICLQLKSLEAFRRAMDHLTSGESATTALFVADKCLCVPLYRYLADNQIRCPEDVSIVCAGDFECAPLLSPPVTVVGADPADAVEELVKEIRQLIYPTESTLEPTAIDARLTIRKSTLPIARGPFGERAESLDALILTEREIHRIKQAHYSSAVSFHYTGKAWMDLTLRGLSDVFQQLGVDVIATTDAHFNPELQVRQLKSIELLKPDILIAVPTDDEKTAQAFKKAGEQSKLIFITHVPNVFKPGEYLSCISVNDRSHGRTIAQGLGEFMVKNNLTRVALLKHSANFSATNQRDSAAEQVFIEEFENIKILDTGYFKQESEAYAATVDMFTRHPQIQALYVPWEGPALQAMQALIDLGRHDVAIATGDLDLASAKVLAAGGMIKFISAQRPYEQGRAVGLAAAIAMAGRKAPPFIAIEPIGVTAENLGEAWEAIYHESLPSDILEAMHRNPQYSTFARKYQREGYGEITN